MKTALTRIIDKQENAKPTRTHNYNLENTSEQNGISRLQSRHLGTQFEGMKASTSSFLDLFDKNGTVELIVDNPRSHCCRSMSAPSTEGTDDSSFTLPSNHVLEQRAPPALISIADPKSTQIYHNSFPPQRRPRIEEDECILFGTWMSSSDSDIDYLFPSFDDMLREKSSATESAMRNISKPMRRRSLTQLSSKSLVQTEEPPTLSPRTFQSDNHGFT